ALPGRQRIAEPGILGDVDEELGVAREWPDVTGEGILVADTDGGPAAGDGYRLLGTGPRRQYRHRHLEIADQRLEQPRQRRVLAERHEMALAIDAGVGVEQDRAVVIVEAALADRDALQESRQQRRR